MRILIYHGQRVHYWIAETRQQFDGAKRALFKMLDDCGTYNDVPIEFREIIKKAKSGDIRCIDAILKMRNGRPNETWSLEVAEIREDKSERYQPNHLMKLLRQLLSNKHETILP